MELAETEMNSEEKTSHEVTPSPVEDALPDKPAQMQGKDRAADEMRDILAKMPIEDKADLQKDYGTIQYINITYQGNHVENSGTVYGSIAQQQGENAHGDAPPAAAETIQDFFRPNARADALAALLTLATLESVQESLFFEISSCLANRLRRGAEPPEDEKTAALAYLQTPDELLSPFSIRRESFPFTYGRAELSFHGLAFCDRQLPEQVRRLAWQMYPQLRPVLVEWLLDFQTRTDTAADRTMAYAAVRGLAAYAALDTEYACRTVIPLLKGKCTAQAGVKYLTAFFREFMQTADGRIAADEVLRQWCGRDDGLLWQIPYQLYSDTEQWRFCQDVPFALRKRLERDCAGLERPETGWYQLSRGYFLYPAHRNSAATALLMREISHCFSGCKTPRARYRTAVYFLVLLRWDYLTDFSPTPELCFLRGFHDKELRTAILPLFRLIWRHFELRSIMRQVLELHFAEINAYSASASYLEKPIAFLAFTNNPTDYQNTIRLLKDCARQEKTRPAAEHLISHLTNILQQRQRDSQINRKGLIIHGSNI